MCHIIFWTTPWNIGADFNNFWHEISRINFTFCPPHLKTTATLYLVKRRSRILASYNSEFIWHWVNVNVSIYVAHQQADPADALGRLRKSLWDHRTSTRLTTPCGVEYASGASLSYQDLGHSGTETKRQQRVGRSESCDFWTCCWRVASACVYVSAGDGHFEHTSCDVILWRCDATRLTFCETVTASNVCGYTVKLSNVYTYLLCWRLNLTLWISRGSEGTYFGWSGHFR